MVETDLMGVDSHGLSMLMTYEEGVQETRIQIAAQPQVLRDTGPTALLDGGDGLGHPVSAMAMNLAVDKAQQYGVGVVGVVNSHHFGAAGAYARIASARGVIGMVTSSTRGRHHGADPRRHAGAGHQPAGLRRPGPRNPAFVLDMATTTVAAGKVKVHHLNDAPLPEGWVVDGAGQGVTDPHEGNAFVFNRPEGGITPVGGTESKGSAKGYGLAMLVHILGGTLVGAASRRSATAPRSRASRTTSAISSWPSTPRPSASRVPSRATSTMRSTCCTRRRRPTRPSRCWSPASRRTSCAPSAWPTACRCRTAWTTLIRGICERAGAPYLLRPNR